MTEQKPYTPPEDRKPTPEEIAILEEGKRQVEQAKMAVGQPVALMTDPTWLVSEEGTAVLAHAMGRGPDGNMRQPRSDLVTVLIPKDFTYNATHSHHFLFRQGVREIPASLLDIKYIRDQGVKVWERPAPAAPTTILGSSSLGPTVRVGSDDKPSGPFVTQAFQESGMSPDEWNSLSDEERGTRALDCASKASAASVAQRTQSGMAVPGAGAGTVQRQPPPNKIAPGPKK